MCCQQVNNKHSKRPDRTNKTKNWFNYSMKVIFSPQTVNAMGSSNTGCISCLLISPLCNSSTPAPSRTVIPTLQMFLQNHQHSSMWIANNSSFLTLLSVADKSSNKLEYRSSDLLPRVQTTINRFIGIINTINHPRCLSILHSTRITELQAVNSAVSA